MKGRRVPSFQLVETGLAQGHEAEHRPGRRRPVQDPERLAPQPTQLQVVEALSGPIASGSVREFASTASGRCSSIVVSACRPPAAAFVGRRADRMARPTTAGDERPADRTTSSPSGGETQQNDHAVRIPTATVSDGQPGVTSGSMCRASRQRASSRPRVRSAPTTDRLEHGESESHGRHHRPEGAPRPVVGPHLRRPVGRATQRDEHVVEPGRRLSAVLDVPLPTEDQPEDRQRESHEAVERPPPGPTSALRTVGGHRRALPTECAPHPDPVGDEVRVREDPPGPHRGGATQRMPEERQSAQHSREQAPGNGGLQDDGRTGQPGSEDPDQVDLDVVRVAVAPVGVVDREHVRTLLAQHARPGRRRIGRRPGWRRRTGRPGRGAGPSRRSPDPRHARIPGSVRRRRARPSDGGQTVAVAIPVAGEATLARGRRDEHDAVSFRGRSAKQATSQQRLVVGVGMERDQRETCARGDHGSNTASSRTPRVRE